MNAKLNFYDVYCFVIPGVTLLGLLWIPLGAARVNLPLDPFSSAVLLVFFGYVVGLVVDNFATKTFESKVAVPAAPSGRPFLRTRSDRMLDDPEVPELTESGRRFAKDEEFKKILFDHIKRVHGKDVKDPGARPEAFFRCRNLLVQRGVAMYVEQMHGMYAMWRSLTAVFLVAGSYYISFGFAAPIPAVAAVDCIRCALKGAAFRFEAPIPAVAAVGCILLLPWLIGPPLKLLLRRPEWTWWRLTLWGLFGVVVGVGCSNPSIGLGWGAPVGNYWYVVVLVGVAQLALVVRASLAYRHFCDLFARQVYYDFVAFVDNHPKEFPPPSAAAATPPPTAVDPPLAGNSAAPAP